MVSTRLSNAQTPSNKITHHPPLTMSQNQQTNSSFTTTSFTTTSISSSTSNGQTTRTGHRAAQQTSTDPSGTTTVRQATQDLGEPVVERERRFDADGREMIGGGDDLGRARIEDVSEVGQEERDRMYEERMEEEYAKREGGA
ncbi:hypothetical protein M433DRAFT_155910 [Acidomyces richmondensis BFW]|nr:MAG: hypothetical protein FE78DRAFT_92658 [Acidomyces sp. 'richmondensis']KYG44171.1 hypothetical protein M433DRAFT_155910 [Acidomyces richmondensis BFW]